MSKTHFLVSGLALAIFASSCSTQCDDYVQESSSADGKVVTLQLSQSSWNGNKTRAEGESSEKLLTPVTLLLVPSERGAVLECQSFTSGSEFSIEVPNGDYEIFAVCGLPSDKIPDNIFTTITIPESDSGSGLTDFAVGSASVLNYYGKVSSSSVSINAKRKMAWLTLTISDVPTDFNDITLSVKGLADSYSIDDGWSTSDEAKNTYTPLDVTRNTAAKTASADLICKPSTDRNNGLEFRIEGKKTAAEKTVTYKYTSSTPLNAGVHLELNLSLSDLVKINETIAINDWNEKTEQGSASVEDEN